MKYGVYGCGQNTSYGTILINVSIRTFTELFMPHFMVLRKIMTGLECVWSCS